MKKIILILLLFCLSSGFAENQWVLKHYKNNERILTMQCLDSNNCFAYTCENSTTRVYKSIDQGDSWMLIYEHDHDLPNDSVWTVGYCQAVNESLIFLSYNFRVIVEKSTDGGETFQRITFDEYSSHEDGINYFVMYDDHIGFICSFKYMFYTTDAWETYKVFQKGEFKYVGEPCYFLDSTKIVMLKSHQNHDEFKLFDITTETWSDYSEGSNADPRKTMENHCFINDSVGFACGGQKNGVGNLNNNIIWKTEDKGRTWKIIEESEGPITGFGLTSIAFRDSLYGIAAASWGVMIETTDGGKTWEYVIPLEEITHKMTPRVAFAGQYPIIGIGLGDGIYRYEDVTDVVSEEETESLSIQQTRDQLIIRQREYINKRISIQIADLLGRNVQSQSFVNQQEINLDISKLNSGFYVYNILSDGRILKTGKLVR
jgi:hypothetical protein